MIIGVAGIGVVGEAMYRSLGVKCEGSNVSIVGYDKYKNIGSFDEMAKADIILLCLPTLYSKELKAYDKSSIHDVCSKLADIDYQGLVVIKSTVEPGTSQDIADQYNLSVAHNPEFLSAATAYEDFHNQSHIIIGATKQAKQSHINNLQNFYKCFYPGAMYTMCSSNESETIKIFCNNFYAVKVQFFTELYILCQQTGSNYKLVVDAMIANGWINPMHTTVPGPDGKLSYGGMCFPKDTNALRSFMDRSNLPHAIIDAAVSERNKMRKE